MMKMKKILLNVAFILAATLLGGCDDFFNPDTMLHSIMRIIYRKKVRCTPVTLVL